MRAERRHGGRAVGGVGREGIVGEDASIPEPGLLVERGSSSIDVGVDAEPWTASIASSKKFSTCA
jgi:hypothetical protein